MICCQGITKWFGLLSYFLPIFFKFNGRQSNISCLHILYMIRSWYCKDCDMKTTLVDDMANVTCTNCGKRMTEVSPSLLQKNSYT